WKFKTLHRLILSSSAYRQSSRIDTRGVAIPGALQKSSVDATTADPENLLLWRMPLRRLESEIIRDAVLATSGKLDRQIGGPAVPIKPLPDGTVAIQTET